MIITPESTDYDVDIFVASRIGSFKHIKYHSDKTKNTKKCVENLVDIKTLQKDDCITCMEWGNKDQTEILIGKKNQQIEVYSTSDLTTLTHTADFAPGHVVGLGRCKRKLLAATSSGAVRIWSKKEETVVQTGGKLDVMKVFDEDPTLFATGGEENELKLWRIGTAEPIFTAKNLAADWLQLRQPVWVSGLAVLPGCGGDLAAVCSRYGYVRLYDTRAQRRPVLNVEFPKMAATCIVPSFDDKQLLVGFGRGQLHQVDLRAGKPDKGFKGSSGAITSIATCGENRLVISCSLDRHLRVHDFVTKDLLYKPALSNYKTLSLQKLDKGSSGAITSIATCGENRLVITCSLDRHLRVHDYVTKDLLYKQYLTSKLSCVLVQTATSTPLQNAPEVKEEEIKEEIGEEEGKEEDDLDTIFDKMETIGEKTKSTIPDAPPAKKAKRKVQESSKPSTEGSTEDTEDAIAKLLRSTEKTKRKREKQKKEKKAKSVFHNA